MKIRWFLFAKFSKPIINCGKANTIPKEDLDFLRYICAISVPNKPPLTKKKPGKQQSRIPGTGNGRGGRKKTKRRRFHISLCPLLLKTILSYFTFLFSAFPFGIQKKERNFHFKRVTGRNSRNKRQMYAGKQVPLTMVLIFPPLSFAKKDLCLSPSSSSSFLSCIAIVPSLREFSPPFPISKGNPNPPRNPGKKTTA